MRKNGASKGRTTLCCLVLLYSTVVTTTRVDSFTALSKRHRADRISLRHRSLSSHVVVTKLSSSETEASSSSSSPSETTTPLPSSLNTSDVHSADDDLWGKAVPINSQPQQALTSATEDVPPPVVLADVQEELQKRRRRNVVVAMASVLVAVLNYAYTYFHPITPVQLLAEMQQQSAPMSSIGTNGKPTVVDFWAPWCENCKLAAPTLQVIEQEYKDRVNFVMVNGDEAKAWPYIEAFGVDAIPHLALVTDEGDVQTALIGPIPKSILEEDLNVLLQNSGKDSEKKPLPHVMLDVFANRPDKRRVHFEP